MIDLERRKVERTAHLSAEPYSSLVSADGQIAVRLALGRRQAAGARRRDARAQGRRSHVGEHPNAMLQSKDGSRLFVACANTNAVWVVDLAAQRATEQIGVALFPNAPPGTTPNALALSPDGETLLVANADNNTVAVVDVSTPGASRVRGFIPTGWYPTGVTFDRDGRRIYVLSGKGLSPAANPRGPQPGMRGADGQYIGDACCRARSRRSRCRTTTQLAGADEARLRGHALRRQDEARRRRTRPSTRRFPARVGASVADQARLLRHPREPHLRSDLRRHPRRQRRSDADALRRGRHAERARAGAGVRPARQLLRRRRGQLRRPRVLDGRLRDRRGREDLADQLRPARRHLPQRGRRRSAQPVRQSLGPAAGLHLGHGHARQGHASAATASSWTSDEKTGVVEASVPGLQGPLQPRLPAVRPQHPRQQARRRLAARSSASSRRTGSCRG